MGMARIRENLHRAVGEAAMLGREGVVERHNAEVWRQVGTVRISREPPLATKAGKILPFQIAAPPGR